VPLPPVDGGPEAIETLLREALDLQTRMPSSSAKSPSTPNRSMVFDTEAAPAPMADIFSVMSAAVLEQRTGENVHVAPRHAGANAYLEIENEKPPLFQSFEDFRKEFQKALIPSMSRQKFEQEALKNPTVGQTIPGKGIYLGVWQPKDRDGTSLGKAFNVYAAPEDLTDKSGKRTLLTFKKTAKRITALRNWHGHDGGNYENDTALYTALANGSYKGEWFIPTRDLLLGSDIDGNKVQSDNLYASKDKRDFKGTFIITGTGSHGNYPEYYWSLAEHRDFSYFVWCARLADGGGGWSNKDLSRQSCRPVRVEALAIQ
jgi:hypothetical protein